MARQRSARILLIDDDPNLIKMMSLVLERAGYRLEIATNGVEALTLVERTNPDLVLLDVMMPFMTGIEVCRRLRGRAETRHLPIIIMSSLDRIEDKLEGFKAGADDYLSKPAHPRELLARIEALLARSRLGRGHKAYTIALLGAKGGVGTTSVAVNVAVALAQRQWAVTLAELKPARGDLRYHVNVPDVPTMAPLLDDDAANIEPANLEKQMVKHSSGLQLLFGPAQMQAPLTPEHAEQLVLTLQQGNDFLLLDLPTVDAPHVRRALELADYTVLTTEPQTLSVLCGHVLLETLDEWGVAERLGVVSVSRTSSGLSLTRMEVENELGLGGSKPREISYWQAQKEGIVELREGVVGMVPPAPEAFQESVAAGVPLVLLDPASQSARALVELAEFFVDRVEAADMAPA